MNRPLRDPIMEAAAQLLFAKGDRGATLRYCRFWVAEHREQAEQIIAAAAREVDKLRAWALIPAAGRTMDESLKAAVDTVASIMVEFATTWPSRAPALKKMTFSHMQELSKNSPVGGEFIEEIRSEARAAITAIRETWLAALEHEDNH